MFNRSWWIFLSQILFTFQTYVNFCIKITHDTKISVYRCYEEKETLPFICSRTLLMTSSSCMRRYSELSCFDTHNLRSLYPRFPPHNFFFTVLRDSVYFNTEIVINLELCLPFFSTSFPVCFFIPWDGRTDDTRDKGTQTTQKLEMRVLHEFIQCYNDVFSVQMYSVFLL